MGSALLSVLGQRKEETSCMTQRARLEPSWEGRRRKPLRGAFRFGFHGEICPEQTGTEMG